MVFSNILWRFILWSQVVDFFFFPIMAIKGPGSLSHVQVQVWTTGRPLITPSSSSHNLSLSMERRGGGWRALPVNRRGFSVLASFPGRTGFPAGTQWNAIWTLTIIRLCLFLFSAKEQSSHTVKRQGCFILARFLSFSVVGEHQALNFEHL